MSTSSLPELPTRIELVSTTDMSVFNNRSNTIFIIKSKCVLNDRLNLGPNCVLDFQGGYIASTDKNGVIVGLNTHIASSKYQIFYDITLSGSYINFTFPVEWFGITGPYAENIDDSIAINTSLQCTKSVLPRVPIELGSSTYNIRNSIVLTELNQSIICNGCINLLNKYIPAIVMKQSRQIVDINEIKCLDTFLWTNFKDEEEGEEEGEEKVNTTGILMSGDVHNSIIKVNKLTGLTVGFELSPSLDNGNIVGCQYNKISWQMCQCLTGIKITIDNTQRLSEGGGSTRCLWVNENQFFGGRLLCKYGIKITGYEKNPNLVNGNVFNCIGFEGEKDGRLMTLPIKISSARLNEFHDLRISESVVQTPVEDEEDNPIGFESTYIDLKNCEFMNFSIKSLIPFNFIKAENCRSITINGAITDIGKGSLSKGRTKILIDKSYPLTDIQPVTDVQNDMRSYKFSLSELVPQNYCKYMSFDSNRLISFDELFVTDINGQMIMSNICRIYRFNSENLEQNKLAIYFENTCYKIHPEMIIYFRGEGTGGKTIEFRNAIFSDPFATITRYGTYKITFDRDDNIFVIPLAYFE